MEEKGGSIALIKKGNNILLDLRKVRGGSMWEIPGGGIEHGETPESAVRREVKEEVDIVVKKLAYIGMKNQAIHWGTTEIDHFFLIDSFSGEPRAYDPVDKETLAIRWIGINHIKDLLNVSWRVVDAMRFLAVKQPVFKTDYVQIRNAFDNRPLYSFENLAYSFNTNKSFLRYKDYIDRRSLGQTRHMLDSLKPPILQINPGYGSITKELVSRFGKVDVVELSPDARKLIKEKMGDGVNFVNGIPEMFKSEVRYNGVVALNSYVYQPSYQLFIKSLIGAMNRNSTLIFSPLKLKHHIMPSTYISYGHTVRSIESYQEFFSSFGFNQVEKHTLWLDRLNNIKTDVLVLAR